MVVSSSVERTVLSISWLGLKLLVAAWFHNVPYGMSNSFATWHMLHPFFTSKYCHLNELLAVLCQISAQTKFYFVIWRHHTKKHVTWTSNDFQQRIWLLNRKEKWRKASVCRKCAPADLAYKKRHPSILSTILVQEIILSIHS